MSQKVIELVQVESATRRPKLHNLEEGDKIGNYKVVNVSEKKCEHMKRRWEFNRQISEDPPKAQSTCLLCGDEKEYVVSKNPE